MIFKGRPCLWSTRLGSDRWVVRRCWLELLESPAVGCVPLLGGHCYPSVCKPCLELGFELLLLPARHGHSNKF